MSFQRLRDAGRCIGVRRGPRDDEDPVGRAVRIGNIPFRVVGVLEAKGGSTQGHDRYDLVVAPYDTVRRKIMGTTAAGQADDFSILFQLEMHQSDAVLLAFAFSALIGVTFELYPALKASRFDPIEALRYE